MERRFTAKPHLPANHCGFRLPAASRPCVRSLSHRRARARLVLNAPAHRPWQASLRSPFPRTHRRARFVCQRSTSTSSLGSSRPRARGDRRSSRARSGWWRWGSACRGRWASSCRRCGRPRSPSPPRRCSSPRSSSSSSRRTSTPPSPRPPAAEAARQPPPPHRVPLRPQQPATVTPGGAAGAAPGAKRPPKSLALRAPAAT